MLILTRRAGESIFIGDDIKVKLMEIKGNQVRVGVDAPTSVKIYREEIYLQILAENKSAAELSQETQPSLDDIAKTWKSQRSQTLNQFQVIKKKPVNKPDK